MPVNLTLNQVEELIEVCQHGSIAAAARALGKSRGAVSMSLSALEDQLGVTLFRRTGNRLAATPITQELLDDFRRLWDLARAIETRCHRHLEGEESLLRIARDDALPEAFWRDLVAEMTHIFPRLSLGFGLSPAAELAGSLGSGAVDLGLGVMEEAARVPGTDARALGPIDMLMVAARDHPLAHLGRVGQEDLHDHPFIGQTWYDERGLRQASLAVRQRVGVSHFELMRDMAADGIGWTLLPAPLASPLLAEGRLVLLAHARAVQSQEFVALRSLAFRDGRISDWLLQRVQDYLVDHGRVAERWRR
ncbi:LysR family transcriptional regulator [Halomonas sp. 328]|uniref:LysR family transcriptional regulator n=1 Tax=Halomonas sp. 328 TaxID=2776704 RepID=UPI0018A7A55E|nr:LysR family transcriptional regulator [Halomonas sp. 328]MBF8223974.1 LysR family transcriptional regulator [Halomonas sp. 328]